jgi:transketolase
MTAIAPPPAAALHDCRDAWIATLVELAAEDSRIVVVVNDSVGSSKLGPFQDAFPDRLVNVGIAEQDMVGVGAGLANGGKVPFVSAAACFLTARAMEQIKVDAAYSQHHIVLVGQSPGMAYGELGPTHHSVEDFSWLRALPGLDIVVPADRLQTRQAVQQAAADPRPTYLRVGRHKVPDVTPEGSELVRGRFQQLRDGADVTIIATGTLVSRALVAAELLDLGGVTARVLNAVYLSPLDVDAIAAAARQTRAIVTAEEANTAGGLGAAVAVTVSGLGRDARVPVRVLGLTEFAPVASTDRLLEHFGLTADGITEAAREALADA